jgi:hypothetical protein
MVPLASRPSQTRATVRFQRTECRFRSDGPDLVAAIYHIREPQKLPLLMTADEVKRLLAIVGSLRVRRSRCACNLLSCTWTKNHYMILHSAKAERGVQMSESVSLRDVPGRFLDQRKWRVLRMSASQELVALTYMNAPYPDEENPGNFFGGRSGTAKDAIRCYNTGRSLLQQCRSLLNAGQLVASGIERSSGKRRTISASEWVNLWPMFATNKAVGPNQAFDDIKVFQAEHRNTSHETLCSECIAWLKAQRTAGLGERKTTLYQNARHRFGNDLTHAIFDAAYLAAFARRRGRPKKSSI